MSEFKALATYHMLRKVLNYYILSCQKPSLRVKLGYLHWAIIAVMLGLLLPNESSVRLPGILKGISTVTLT